MTKDEALTMIIASIAMEELALSHIVNAEGEKIQYVLGTLPGGPGACADSREILAVNRSVTELLNTVMHSQLLLKGKLEKALEACGPGPEPAPPCPCGPPRGGKSAIRLAARCGGFAWDGGFLLSWKCLGRTGSGIRWSEEAPAQVDLDPGRAYALSCTINARGPCRGGGAGAVLVRLVPCGAFSEVLPLYFSAQGPDCQPMTLHGSALLFPQGDPAPRAGLSLLLAFDGSLFVEQASLDVFEI